MAISQNFPNTRPSLNLNFARSRKLDSRITFTRGSTATYVDESGLIRTAGINEARFDYDPITGESLGLLIEESRTNLLVRSQELDNLSWERSNVTVTANSTLAPDGTTTADTITRTGGGSIYQDVGGQSGTGTYTYSVFLKAGTETSITLAGWLIGSGSNNFISLNINVNTSTGVMTLGSLGAGSSASITPYPNGWYRVTATGTGNNAANTTARFEFYFGGNNSYVVWGAQLEVASFPTSYIPTVASSVTRSADTASITGTNFTDWYNQYPFSVFSSYKIPYVSTTNFPRIWEISNNSGDNRINHYLTPYPAPTYASGGIVQSGSVVASQGPAATLNQNVKTATRFAINNFSHTVNGINQGTDTVCDFSATVRDRMFIGSSIDLADRINSTIAQISYYPVALTNAQLQDLTK